MEYKIKIKKKNKNLFNDIWVWNMALKDAKKNYSRLFLFISSIIIGIAALVAISSFNINLHNDINVQAKELLGADFVVHANNKYESDLQIAFDSTAHQQASDVNLASMVSFMTSTPGVRLVRVVAIDGDFPFYGEIETVPTNAYPKIKNGEFALVDANLATQYDVSADDSIKVGRLTFKVAGEVRKIPGGGGVQSTFTPSIYISKSALDLSGLIQYGSRVNYNQYFLTKSDEETSVLEKDLKPMLKKYGHSYETVQSRKENLGSAFENMYRFFNLLAFIALILGCIGVASSVHIYVREKRETIAVLRCIGASGWQAFNIFFIQTFFLGLIGSILGILLGSTLQISIPLLLNKIIPVDMNVSIAWAAIGQGLLLGVIIALLFSILPLISVRFIPPLVVLRTGFEIVRTFSKTRLITLALIILFPLAFAAYLTKSWMMGGAFFLALLVAFGCLAAIARVLMSLVKRYFPTSWSFIWRQSLSNLFRPNNQTTTMIVVIGLGTFLITTLNLVQNSLLNQVEFVGSENDSNTILFDIQSHQKEGVTQLAKDHGLPINQSVPIVTSRLQSLKGKTITEVQSDTSNNIPNWALTREYRVTYRDSLHHSETMIKGEIQHVVNLEQDSVFVTISEGLSESLELDIGDEVVFDVQGVPITTYIGGIRKVDWPKDPPNFIFVFPNGVLEEAPQIFVLTTRIDEKITASQFQRELVAGFPNVSAIDLRLILNTIEDFFDKVSFVIQFMALFSIITGLVVLIGAVINSKFLRLKENVLLRTIGATRKQIIGITLIEYAYLGFFAGFTGISLSWISSWLLAVYFFEIEFFPPYLSTSVIWILIIALTSIIGWFNTRDVVNSSPLEVLRRED